jgi:hypothetical protein
MEIPRTAIANCKVGIGSVRPFLKEACVSGVVVIESFLPESTGDAVLRNPVMVDAANDNGYWKDELWNVKKRVLQLSSC